MLNTSALPVLAARFTKCSGVAGIILMQLTAMNVASAQSVVKPLTATASVNAVTGIVAAPVLTQTPQQGNPCNPGACFIGSVAVNANQAWQLQVRVKPSAPTTFYVNWLTPANAQFRLSSEWFVIRTNNAGSSNDLTALWFNANKATGKGGLTPTAAQLSSYLEFRAVGYP